MGASIGMAKGAADAGLQPAVAVIGDSTFLHSGVTPLMDAVAADTDMTLIILDNETTAMTGGQPTILPRVAARAARARPRRRPGALPRDRRRTARTPRRTREIIRREIEHPGLSVIIAVRECIETREDEGAGQEGQRTVAVSEESA